MKTNLKTLYLLGLIYIGLEANSQNPTTVEGPKKQSDLHTKAKTTELGAFYAIPLGDFAQTDLETGGFAKPGFGFFLDSKNELGSGFSFVSHSSYSWLDIDETAMGDAFTKYLNTKAVVQDGQYQPFLTTVGLGYDYYFSKRAKFGINGQAGIVYNTFKPLEIYVYGPNNTLLLSETVSFQSGFGFGFNFGADFRYDLKADLIAFKIFADYSSANMNTYLISQTSAPSKTFQKLQMLNVGIGLVFYTQK